MSRGRMLKAVVMFGKSGGRSKMQSIIDIPINREGEASEFSAVQVEGEAPSTPMPSPGSDDEEF